MTINWSAVPRWMKSGFHVVLAIPMQLLTAALFFVISAAVLSPKNAMMIAVMLSWAGPVWFFYGREVAQLQDSLKKPGESTATVAAEGWRPDEWDRWSIVDWLAPMLWSIFVSIILYLRFF